MSLFNSCGESGIVLGVLCSAQGLADMDVRKRLHRAQGWHVEAGSENSQ